MNDPQANLPASDVSLNQNQSLDIAEEVLNEIAGTTSTTPITSKSSNLNPAIPVGSTQKEMLYPQTVEVTPGAGIAQVEVEPKVEISQDIEEFLKRVEDRDKEELKNIVIADESKPSKGDEALLYKDTIVIQFSQKIEKEYLRIR